MERYGLYEIFSKVLGGYYEDFSQFSKAYDDINKALVRAKRSERDLAVEVLKEMTEDFEIDSKDAELYIDFIDSLNQRRATRAPEVRFKKRISYDVNEFKNERVSLWIVYLDRLKVKESMPRSNLKVMDKAVAAAKLFNKLSELKDKNQRHFINSYYIINYNRLKLELKDSLSRVSDLNSLLEQKENIINQLQYHSNIKNREIEALKETLAQAQKKIESHDHILNDKDLVWDCEMKQSYLKLELEDKEKLIKKLLYEIMIKDEALKDKSDCQDRCNPEHSYIVRELELRINHLNSELQTKDDIITLLKSQCLKYISSHHGNLELELEGYVRLYEEYGEKINTYSLQVEDYESRIQILKNEILEKGELCTRLQRDYRDLTKELGKQINHYEKDLNTLIMKGKLILFGTDTSAVRTNGKIGEFK
jgi:hypothetical protein